MAQQVSFFQNLNPRNWFGNAASDRNKINRSKKNPTDGNTSSTESDTSEDETISNQRRRTTSSHRISDSRNNSKSRSRSSSRQITSTSSRDGRATSSRRQPDYSSSEEENIRSYAKHSNKNRHRYEEGDHHRRSLEKSSRSSSRHLRNNSEIDPNNPAHTVDRRSQEHSFEYSVRPAAPQQQQRQDEIVSPTIPQKPNVTPILDDQSETNLPSIADLRNVCIPLLCIRDSDQIALKIACPIEISLLDVVITGIDKSSNQHVSFKFVISEEQQKQPTDTVSLTTPQIDVTPQPPPNTTDHPAVAGSK